VFALQEALLGRQALVVDPLAHALAHGLGFFGDGEIDGHVFLLEKSGFAGKNVRSECRRRLNAAPAPAPAIATPPSRRWRAPAEVTAAREGSARRSRWRRWEWRSTTAPPPAPAGVSPGRTRRPCPTPSAPRRCRWWRSAPGPTASRPAARRSPRHP